MTANGVPQQGARDYDVDARTFVRLVRLSRELRFLWQFTLLGTLLWGTFVLAVERSTTEGSAQWNRVDSDASPGFIALLVVAGVALAAHLAIRLAGRAGKATALLVPPIGAGAPTTVVSGEQAGAGLLAALRRGGYVSFGLLTALLVFTAMVIALAVGIWPDYQASHGRGGTVVTIGDGATVTSYVMPVSGRGGGGTIYRLNWDRGVADAEGNAPRDGQQWTIIKSPQGGDDVAYLIGGHTYVFEALAGIVFLAIDLAIVFFGYLGFKAERRRRKSADHVSLADSLGAFAAGQRTTLVVGKETKGYKGRPIPPLTVTIGSS